MKCPECGRAPIVHKCNTCGVPMVEYSKQFGENIANDITTKAILEIYRFLTSVCMSLHCRGFADVDPDSIWDPEFIKESLIPRQIEDVSDIWQIAEDIGGLYIYLNNSNRNIFLPELSMDKNHIQNCYDNLRAILDILEAIEAKYPLCSLIDNWFDSRCNAFCINKKPIGHGDFPDLTIWIQILPVNKFKKIQKSVDDNGKWKKSISDIISAFAISFPLIIELLKKIDRSNTAVC